MLAAQIVTMASAAADAVEGNNVQAVRGEMERAPHSCQMVAERRLEPVEVSVGETSRSMLTTSTVAADLQPVRRWRR